MSDVIAEPTFEPSPDAPAFYDESLRLLKESGIPLLLSGAYAATAYSGVRRPTKDLDVFCKPGDDPRIPAYFQKRGYRIDVEDERWTVAGEPPEIHAFLGSSRLAETIDR